jgi:hypothetical protein
VAFSKYFLKIAQCPNDEYNLAPIIREKVGLRLFKQKKMHKKFDQPQRDEGKNTKLRCFKID